MRRWAFASMLVAGSQLAGCRNDSPAMRDEPVELETGREPTGGDDDGPRFIDPPSSQITISINRLADLILRVSGVVEGSTRLEIDGVSVGTLPEGDPIGRLTDGELRLHLRGAMVPGRHTLVLVEGSNASAEVEVFLEPGDGPELVASVAAQPTVPGTHLRSLGAGPTARLVIADGPEGNGAPDPVLRVFEHDEGRWSTRPSIEVSAEDLVLGDAIEEAPFAVGSGPTVAWRVGDPGRALTVWSDGATQRLEIASALRQGVEAVAVGDPVLVDDAIVGSLRRLADTETSRPGDVLLVNARFDESALDVVPLEPTEDIDRLGPLLDPIAAEFQGPPAVMARVATTRSAVFEVDPLSGLPRAARGLRGAASRRMLAIRGPLVGLRGAFGSRTLVGLDPEGPVILRIDDFGLGGVVDVSPGDRLPVDAVVTGPLALGIVGGTTVVLVPYGEAEDVHAIALGEEAPRVQSLGGLRCDQIAMAATPLPPEVGIALACATAGSVRFGQISALPQP